MYNIILMTGLTVWFDKTGGKDKITGIKYPIGVMGNNRNPGDIRSMRNMSQEDRMEMMDRSLKQFELVGADGIVLEKLDTKNSKGIEMAINIENQTICYELKIPLYKKINDEFEITVNDDDVIGVGFVTADMRELFEKRRSERGEGGFGGRGRGVFPGGSEGFPGNGVGFPEGGEGRPGGMGRSGNMDRGPQQSEPLDFWLKVNLSFDKPLDPG